MAILSNGQAKELLARNRSSALLQCERDHERLRLHVEEVDSHREASPAIGPFLDRARSVMTGRKYERFVSLLRFPLESNKLTRKIFADLRRVFDGKNRSVRAVFTSAAAEADMELWRRERLRDEEFFEEDVFEHMRAGINDFIVVDLARQVDGRPEPMPFIVRVEDVVAVEVNRDNECEFMAYKVREGRVVVIDEESYRVYVQDEKSLDWALERQAPHPLGYCPAKPIWSDYKRSKENFVEKTGPISAALSDFDEVNFWDVGNRYYQLYGAFPIYWEYKTQCRYHDAQGNACEDGWINYTEPGAVSYDPVSGEKQQSEPSFKQRRCPECEKNENIFAGSRVQVEAPQSREDADLREPMGFVGVDAQALKFNQEAQQQRRQQAMDFCVGINTEPMSSQAINEKQVGSFFEDRKAILFRVKRNFELIHAWTLKTCAKLRYGAQFTRVYVNYGDEFYLHSETELVERYETARKAGLPSYLLQSNRRLLSDTRFRTDPQAAERARILEDLEPYVDHTVSELMAIKQQLPEAVSTLQLALKMDFSNFIARFERENTNILIFASNLTYKEKIDKIQQKLIDYAKQQLKEAGELAAGEHARQVARLEAEARANGAGNGPGKPGTEATRQNNGRNKKKAD